MQTQTLSDGFQTQVKNVVYFLVYWGQEEMGLPIEEGVSQMQQF